MALIPPVLAARSVSARIRSLSAAVKIRRCGRSSSSGELEAGGPPPPGPRARGGGAAPPAPAGGLVWRPPPPRAHSEWGAWASARSSFRALKSKIPGALCLTVIGTEGSRQRGDATVLEICIDAVAQVDGLQPVRL